MANKKQEAQNTKQEVEVKQCQARPSFFPNPVQITYAPRSAVCNAMPCFFLREIGSEYVCACERRIRRTRPETAKRDPRCEPRPRTKQKTRLHPMPHAPFAMHRRQTISFSFCFASQSSQSSRTNVQNQKSSSVAAVAMLCARCFIAWLIPCIAQPFHPH